MSSSHAYRAARLSKRRKQLGYQIALQVKGKYLKHGVIQNGRNVPSVSHDEYLGTASLLVLAERLGAFLAQASEGTLKKFLYAIGGHIAEWKTELIRNAASKAFERGA